MDERWANMHAHVGFPQGFIYDGVDAEGEPQAANPFDWIEFFIEVTYDGGYYFVRQVLTKDDLADFTPPMYAFLLNEMVERMDWYLETEDRSLDGHRRSTLGEG